VKVVQLKIENFRGIESADLRFEGHALLVGSNNVGKSTICEALDLVLASIGLSTTTPLQFKPRLYLPVPSQLNSQIQRTE
jgi:putative ATP-dependent endonuclease of the OLD family